MEINPKYNTLIVNNLEKSIAFYRDIIGWNPIFAGEIEESGKLAIMQGKNGQLLQLVESFDFPTGLYAIGTEVDNMDEVLAYLTSKNIKIIGPVIKTPLGKEAFIEDINGIKICLIEHSVTL